MRLILLLFRCSTLSRGSLGKPSSRTTALSDRSMLSNWFCRRVPARGEAKWRRSAVRQWAIISFPCQRPCCPRRPPSNRTSVVPRFSIAAILLARRSISYSPQGFIYWGLRSTSSAVSLPMMRGPRGAPAPLTSIVLRGGASIGSSQQVQVSR